MADRETHRVSLAQPYHYELPDDLVFEGLAAPRGKELIRLRFSRRRGTTIDLPLSADALEGLVQEVGLLHGRAAQEMKAELDDLHSKGLQILK
jgi:hypothetical protein